MANSEYENLKGKIAELQAKHENNISFDTYDMDDQLAELKNDLYYEEGNMSEEEKELLTKQLDRLERENDIAEKDDMQDMMFPKDDDD